MLEAFLSFVLFFLHDEVLKLDIFQSVAGGFLPDKGFEFGVLLDAAHGVEQCVSGFFEVTQILKLIRDEVS